MAAQGREFESRPDSLRGVTVVYMSNLLFGDELMERLAQRIEDSSEVRVVAKKNIHCPLADSDPYT